MLTIRIDTREQRPLIFIDDNVSSIRSCVHVFDYAVDGDEYFAVERKSLQDFISSVAMQDNWDREIKKIKRARQAGIEPVYYVVEANFNDIERYPFRKFFKTGKVTAGFIWKRWRTLCYNYRVNVIFAGDEAGAARAIMLILKSRNEELSTMSDENKHAKHSPSSLKYKEICPGWTNDRFSSNTAALAGTKMHRAVETRKLDGLDEEEKRLVDICARFTDKLAAGGDVYKELKLDMAGLTYGTADLVVHRPKSCHVDVVDYKFGRVRVDDAEINIQGWCYTLGAMDKFNAKTANMIFIAPRLNEISEAAFIADDRERIIKRISMIINAAENCEVEDLNPNNHNCCRFCGCAGFCPALAKKSTKLLASGGIGLPADLDPQKITEPAQLAKIMDILPAIKHWTDEIKRVAAVKAKAGFEIPGYSLVERKGRRSLNDVVATWQVVKEFYDVKINDFLGACSISVEKLDNIIKQKTSKEGAGINITETFRGKGIMTIDEDVSYLKKRTDCKDGKILTDNNNIEELES